jgi:hypothetical protein
MFLQKNVLRNVQIAPILLLALHALENRMYLTLEYHIYYVHVLSITTSINTLTKMTANPVLTLPV